MHERVNEKLDVDYGVTYEDIVNKYESYRAKCSNTKKKEKGCITPLDKKSQSYKMAYIKDSPIIPYNLVQKFTKYAKMRGLESSEFRYLDKCKCKNDYKNIISDKCCDFWCERNKECNEIIKKMRIQGIPSLESDGRWNGLPTKNELKLILRYSSNLPASALEEIVPKLPQSGSGRKIYKLVR